jgi:hypothetical protein
MDTPGKPEIRSASDYRGTACRGPVIFLINTPVPAKFHHNHTFGEYLPERNLWNKYLKISIKLMCPEYFVKILHQTQLKTANV